MFFLIKEISPFYLEKVLPYGNNKYNSMVFIKLRGCLPYLNKQNVLECECMYGMYGSYYDCNIAMSMGTKGILSRKVIV